jgi:glycosyltransferase involved in cell wall biosynthesis
MSECDVFVFPSLQEGSPGVVSEALSLGLPVVCLNLHGQADMVDESCGFKIRAGNPRQATRDLCEKLSLLCSNPEMVTKLSKGALVRAKKFTADAQFEVFCEAYDKCLTGRCS